MHMIYSYAHSKDPKQSEGISDTCTDGILELQKKKARSALNPAFCTHYLLQQQQRRCFEFDY